MKGSIRQRGSASWELRIYVGTDSVTRKRLWATRTVRGERADAERALGDLAAQANVAPAVGARTTVAELLDQWVARGRSSWAPTTVRNVRSIVDTYLKGRIGDMLVGDLTAAMVDDLYAKLRVDGRGDGQPLGTGTVRRVHSVLHAALAQAVRWGWVFDNVAAHASPPAAAPAEMRPPTAAEVADLLAFVHRRDRGFGLFLTLAATTGARRGELLALRWSDVDLVGAGIAFQRSLVEGPGGPVVVPTKTRRAHRVALDPSSADALRAHRGTASVEGTDGFVFAAYGSSGLQPWRPNYVTKRFIELRQAAGLRHFRLHDLRHFMATEMLDAGVPVPIVAARLAHQRASTTLNVYAHAVPGGDQMAAKVLWHRLAGIRRADLL